MSPDGTAQSAPDLLDQIWNILTTLTEEAMAAAQKKCMEMSFDPNRGVISLAETFINLSSARNVLADAIDQKKLIQLPITLQRELLANLTEISRALQGLTAGTDEVVNLVNTVENLNTSIWRYGLHNLSDQVLGYQKKLNQLKNLEVQLNKGIAELDSARKAAETASGAAAEIEQRRADATAATEQLKQFTEKSAELLKQITDTGTQSAALHSTIQQQEKQAGELTSSIKTASNELVSLDASIRKFYGAVEEYRGKINETNQEAAELIRTSQAAVEGLTADTTAKTDAAIASLQKSETALASELRGQVEGYSSATNEKLTALIESTAATLTTSQEAAGTKLDKSIAENNERTSALITETQAKTEALQKESAQRSEQTIEANYQKTASLTERLAKLEDEIRDKIDQATGYTLFGAFQKRQNQVVISKAFWKWAILALILASALVTTWIAFEAKSYKVTDVALWVKLSLTIPLGYGIGFCTLQYSRERRLEEEYAFKSAVSVSLNPYRELIRSMLDKDGALEQAKYTQFVIDSVSSVFTAPTDKVFESEKKHGDPKKLVKELTELAGAFAKAAK